jgi:hypothetical protein
VNKELSRLNVKIKHSVGSLEDNYTLMQQSLQSIQPQFKDTPYWTDFVHVEGNMMTPSDLWTLLGKQLSSKSVLIKALIILVYPYHHHCIIF